MPDILRCPECGFCAVIEDKPCVYCHPQAEVNHHAIAPKKGRVAEGVEAATSSPSATLRGQLNLFEEVQG